MIIGDAVNFASRIEAANKEHDTSILISEAVYKEVDEIVRCRQSLEVMVKGKQGRHLLFEVTGLVRG
jgi:adenylate cyclase